MKDSRRPARPTISHRVEYFLLLIVVSLGRWVPRPLHGPLADALGLLWYYAAPFRRSVVLENLARAFPRKSRSWRRRVARRCAAHFARMMGLEFPAMCRHNAADLRAWLPEIVGIEHYHAVGGPRKPWVFVSGHLGNWELVVAYFAAVHDHHTAVLAKPLHNPLVESKVVQVRRARGYEVIYARKGGMHQVLRARKEGKTLAFLADQDARRGGIMVPFFSVPASTAPGPAFFAYKMNLPILVGTCRRVTRDGRYRLRFHPPLFPDTKADQTSEITRLTRAHMAILESAIRRAPEQYFWFHKRWKTQLKKPPVGPASDRA